MLKREHPAHVNRIIVWMFPKRTNDWASGYPSFDVNRSPLSSP
jgi:hypothetical protein